MRADLLYVVDHHNRIPNPKVVRISNVPDYFEKNVGLQSNLPDSGEIFIDVGANEGAWTIPFAKRYRKVYAFEPDARAYIGLQQNLTKEHLTNVAAYPTAVGSSDTSLTMATYESTVHTKPLFNADLVQSVNPHSGGFMGNVIVPCTTLDSLCASIPPDTEGIAVKIDVEGGEVEVLLGAAQLITTFKPKLFVEIHATVLKQECMKLLVDYGYDIEIIRHPHFKPDHPAYDFHMWLAASPKK